MEWGIREWMEGRRMGSLGPKIGALRRAQVMKVWEGVVEERTRDSARVCGGLVEWRGEGEAVGLFGSGSFRGAWCWRTGYACSLGTSLCLRAIHATNPQNAVSWILTTDTQEARKRTIDLPCSVRNSSSLYQSAIPRPRS